MRHRVKSRRLGRLTGHRLSMLRNLAVSLLRHGRITTTETRAKELSQFVSRMITNARQANQATDAGAKLAAKREVFQQIPGAERRGVGRPDRDVAQTLFDQIAPRFAERKGGYTRILKLGFRKGDGAPMALIELVGG